MTEQTTFIIDSLPFSWIVCGRTQFELSRLNKKIVRCRDCDKEILPGLGIYRHEWRHTGYVCMGCLSKSLPVLTHSLERPDHDLGFFYTSSGNLQACFLSSPKFSTKDVLQAVLSALLDNAYTLIDHLIAEESASPIQVGDVAESIL